MPQISHIKHSDIKLAQRFDAEYFKPEYLEIEAKLNLSNSQSLSNPIAEIFDGNHLEIEKYFTSSGIPYYRGQDLGSFFTEDVSPNLIPQQVFNQGWMKRSHFRENDILLSIVGTVGNVGFVTDKIGVATGSCKIAIIRPINIEPLYLAAFMQSRFGQLQIKRITRGAVQTGVILADIPLIKVFVSNNSKQISDIMSKAIELNRLCKSLYTEAEKLLLSELGLLDYQVQNTLTFSTTRSTVSDAGRYDSEYFQPKYAEIIRRIERYDGGYDIMKNIIDFRDQNFTPKDDIVYNYLALSNISSQGYIQDFQNDIGKDLPSRARRRVRTGDVIISSIEGSLSSCAIIEPEFDNAICSTGFFVLRSEKMNPQTLLILFKSPIIQELLQRGSKGTILTAISKTELESIKIPLIKPSIQSQIAEKIQQSHKLRKESRELLERAKKMVEEEVEKGINI